MKPKFRSGVRGKEQWGRNYPDLGILPGDCKMDRKTINLAMELRIFVMQ